MPYTEQELREALRHIAETAAPDVHDRVLRVERRARARRRRHVLVTAAVMAAVVGVPLARWLPDRSFRDASASADVTPQQMDAMMKYATFVAWWDGQAEGLKGTYDPGVRGVHLSTTLPPFTCAVAMPDEGLPSGTQAGWVLGSGEMIAQGGPTTNGPGLTTVTAMWPTGVTDCGVRPRAQSFVDAPSSRDVGMAGAAPTVWVQAYADPSKPALDVESVFAQVPQDRLTDVGRRAMAQYRALLPKVDFGTPAVQTDRALTSLAAWISIGAWNQSIHQPPAQIGPLVLESSPYDDTLDLPTGFSVRWTPQGTFCVDGAVGGSAVRRIQSRDYAGTDPGAAPRIENGRCP